MESERFLEDLQRTHARLLRLTHVMALSESLADHLDAADPGDRDGVRRVLVTALPRSEAS